MKENPSDTLAQHHRSGKKNTPMVSIKQMWTAVQIYWHWLLISVSACLLVALLYLWFTPTKIAVIGKMQLISKSNDNSNISAGLAMLSNLPFASSLGGGISSSLGIESEKEILSSTSIAHQVVLDLGLHTEYRLCNLGRKILLYQNNPLNVLLDSTHLQWLDSELPQKFHQIKLTISKKDGKYIVEPMIRENGDKTYLPDQVFSSLPATIKTSAGTLTIVENNLPSEVAELYEKGYVINVTITPPIEAAKRVASCFNFAPPSKKVTNMLDITFIDENLIRGIDVVNKLVVAYNNRANDEKNEEARKTDEFVNVRLAKIDQELGSSDAAWENSKKNFQITTPEIDAQEVIEKRSVYESQLVKIGTELKLHDYLYDYVSDPANLYEIIPSAFTSPSTGSDVSEKDNSGSSSSAGTASLLVRHNALVTQRNNLIKSVSEKSPQFQRVSSFIQELHPTILTALKRDKEAVLMKKSILEREYDKYMKRVGNAPKMERVLTEIGRQREIKQGVYLLMLQKREEAAMTLANTSDKGKLIDPPCALDNSARPQKMLIVMLALFIGIILPVIVIYVLLLFKSKVDTSLDLNALTKYPILGEVTMADNDESIRSIRNTMLLHLKPGQKVIAVCSKRSGDGRTYIAHKLVDSLNGIGRKTMLIDADFRKNKTNIHPADILVNQEFLAKLNQIKAENEFVIIDTPPLGKYSDAFHISGFFDSTIYVVRAEKTVKSDIIALKDESRLPQLLLLVNGIDMSKKKFKILNKDKNNG